MRLNIFEGARRLNVLVMGVWVIGCVVVAYNDSPYLTQNYSVTRPNQPARLANDEDACQGGDRGESGYKETTSGRRVYVSICFRAAGPAGGERLVPFRIDKPDNAIWGAANTSPEVIQYARRYMSDFQIPKADEPAIEKEWRSRRWELAQERGLALVGGVAFFWIAAWVIGWIVRGFLGIPRGMDAKPSSKESAG